MRRATNSKSDLSSKSTRIPVSLGKPSLRVRLEAYYSLIEPSRLHDKTNWRKNVDEIYKKYGGSYEGERKLSSKLVKKYGSTVKLLLAEPEPTTVVAPSNEAEVQARDIEEFEECWYDLSRNKTGDINFCSVRFDPVSVLKASEAEVGKANSWFEDTPIPILDNTLQFAKLLPAGDPLRRNPTTATRHTSQDTSHTRKKQRLSQPSHPFDIIIDSLKTGPCSVLHKFQRQRVCVVTRYVNSIRGSVTGILVAFDKHMNLILRDVEEVYSPRPLERHVMTNVELELERRRKILEDSDEESSEGWSVKRRNMKQIMLRGDNVVSVYRAEDESSRGKKTSH